MKTKLGLYHSTFVIILVILFGSCTSMPNADILSGSDTCKPPCWMDIQPGTTKTDDVIEILREHEINGEGKLTLLNSGIVRWQTTDGYNSYIYAVDNELVTKTEIDLRSTSIHLDDVIAIFGTPSKLDIGKISDGYFFATIFYPEKGLAFVVGGNKFDLGSTTLSFTIQSDMVAVKGLFFQPLDIPAIVNLLYGTNAVSEALSDIQDWTGYGVYRE